jgi:hypothetical protein
MTSQSSVISPNIDLKRAQSSEKHSKKPFVSPVFALPVDGPQCAMLAPSDVFRHLNQSSLLVCNPTAVAMDVRLQVTHAKLDHRVDGITKALVISRPPPASSERE